MGEMGGLKKSKITVTVNCEKREQNYQVEETKRNRIHNFKLILEIIFWSTFSFGPLKLDWFGV